MYKNWLPAGEETQRRHPRHYDDVGAILEAGGGAVAKDFPDLESSEVPTLSAGPVQPLQQRRHPSTKAKVWEWQKRNLSPKHLPASSVRPRNVQNCRSEVQLFLEMLLADNLELVTIHGQICVLNDVSIFRQGIFVKTAGQILKSI